MNKNIFKKILIVDDDPAIQKVLRIQLENSGLDCHLAKSGGEALEIVKAEKFSPDCILSDIKMPGPQRFGSPPSVKNSPPPCTRNYADSSYRSGNRSAGHETGSL